MAGYVQGGRLNVTQQRERITGTLERIARLHRVAGHMALEDFDRVEFLLVADPPDEGDVNRPTVKVAVKVEQKYLEQRCSVIEHRAAAEARNPVMTFPRDLNAHRVDAVLETARGSELQIGRRKTQLATALVAMDDLAGNEPGRAQQLGRLDDPSRRKRRTHRTG